MLAVHALWSSGHGLGFWAEDSDVAVTSRSEALRTARRHPFAASTDELAAWHGGKPGTGTLLLPSLRKSPLDSPELVRVSSRPAPPSTPSLLPWSVPVLWVDVSALDEVGDGVRYGTSVAFFAELARFAHELVDRGRILPGLVRDADGPSARWRPVLQGPDVVAFDALVAAMPPVCRAAVAEPTDIAGPDPHDLAVDALAALVDGAQRQRLAGSALLPSRRGRRPRRLPAQEAWLSALCGGDDRFDADPAGLDTLERALAPWAEVGVGEAGPAHATFRLTDGLTGDDPDADGIDPTWRLQFLLQSVQDPSLLVPAEQAWGDGAGLARWLDRPQELLLAELGRAGRVYPELAAALDVARPCNLDLDTDGAHRFLSEGAELLSQAGFGVLLPSWWDRRARLGLTVSAQTPVDGVVSTTSRFGRDQLVEFHWQLALGHEALTEEEISALAEAKAPLVRVRGQWVAVDPEQLRRGLDFLRRRTGERKPVAEVLRLAASHPDDTDTPLPVTAVDADGRLGALLNGTAEQVLEPIPTPAGLNAQLRPYQRRGLSWLSFLSDVGLGGCLADDMGLGKTVQLLALERLQRNEDPDLGPTLLVCPMSVLGNWQREAATFTPDLRVYCHHGQGRHRGEALDAQLEQTDLIFTTYATAVREADELAARDWRRVVLDEAQAVKNALSRSSVAVRRLAAGQRLALTGTPLENRLAELWSIMDFVNPGMLGSSEHFRTRYSIPVERHGATEPAERLRTITRPYVLRRLKSDPTIIDDLPDKIEIKQYCHLTTEQASLYRSVVDDMLEKIENTEGIERRGNVLAAMTKLKQVCNHPAQLLRDRSAIGHRSGKVLRLEEVLGEILAEGDKALCFTQYTAFAEMMLPHLSARFGRDVLYLHGGTPKVRRDEIVQRFQADSGPAIFLLSLRAGGTGLNLTAANHVLHLDRWWNPAVENQATDRAFRIGQRRHVQVRKFVTVGTLEERIDALIEEKKALADLVISDGEGWLTELSTGSLRELFTLSEGAVDD